MDQKLLGILGGNKDRYPSNLDARYPHVLQKIMKLWDTPELEDYFEELLNGNRSGRLGFPPDITTELLHLKLVNETQHSPSHKKDTAVTTGELLQHCVEESRLNPDLLARVGGKAERYPHKLEREYPRILEKIIALWDSPELDQYFSELLVDERGDRAGFPPEVAREIMHLNLAHSSQQALAPRKHDLWDTCATLANFIHVDANGNAATSINLPEASKRTLRKLGIPCSVDGFLRAAEAGLNEAVELFLQAKVSTETRNEKGWTALMLAAHYGKNDVLQSLLRHGANVNARDLANNTALHWAAYYGNDGATKTLVENKAQINAVGDFAPSPLLMMTARRHQDSVRLLLENGANPNATTRDNWTALHKAVAMGYTEIVKLLLAHGASIDIRNADGDTPVKLAIKYDQRAILELFASARSQPSGKAP